MVKVEVTEGYVESASLDVDEEKGYEDVPLAFSRNVETVNFVPRKTSTPGFPIYKRAHQRVKGLGQGENHPCHERTFTRPRTSELRACCFRRRNFVMLLMSLVL